MAKNVIPPDRRRQYQGACLFHSGFAGREEQTLHLDKLKITVII
jgi:hypothetical protein